MLGKGKREEKLNILLSAVIQRFLGNQTEGTLRKKRWPSCNLSKVPPRTTAPYEFGGERFESAKESFELETAISEIRSRDNNSGCGTKI